MKFIFDAIFICGCAVCVGVIGGYLFFSKTWLRNSTDEQRRRGREVLALYQETRFYFWFVKSQGLAMMMGAGWLVVTVAWSLITRRW